MMAFKRDLKRYAYGLGLALSLCACSTTSTSGDAALDSQSVDQKVDQEMETTEASVDLPVRHDQTADIAKPPARWEAISGAPQVTDHQAVLLDDGRVLIVGGEIEVEDGSYTFVEETFLYDPKTDSFVSAGKLSVPRTFHTAAALDDGRVVVAGGKSADSCCKAVEIFDPSTSTWSIGPDMPAVRLGHAMTKLGDGRLLVTGGRAFDDSTSTAYLFDPDTTSWSTLMSPMKEARRLHTATLLTTGKVLITGGAHGAGSSWTNTSLDTIEVFDPDTGTFSLL